MYEYLASGLCPSTNIPKTQMRRDRREINTMFWNERSFRSQMEISGSPPAQIGQLHRAVLSLWAQNNKSKWVGISWPFYTSLKTERFSRTLFFLNILHTRRLTKSQSQEPLMPRYNTTEMNCHASGYCDSKEEKVSYNNFIYCLTHRKAVLKKYLKVYW